MDFDNLPSNIPANVPDRPKRVVDGPYPPGIPEPGLPGNLPTFY